MSLADDRRSFLRLCRTLDHDLSFRPAGAQHDEDGVLVNLSPTGALFEGPLELEVGSRLTVMICPRRREKRPVEIEATVVRCLPGAADGRHQVACTFVAEP